MMDSKCSVIPANDADTYFVAQSLFLLSPRCPFPFFNLVQSSVFLHMATST
jgi:hypothetical protein